MATGVLAVLAYKQMKGVALQAQAATDQVKVMRQASADELRAVGDQVRASVEQGEAIREAARAQLQPIVFAHMIQWSVRGPDKRLQISEGQVAFPYYLANEGIGIALNIRHGVEIAGTDYEFGDGMEFRALSPGEAVPPRDPVSGTLLEIRPVTVVMDERELPPAWEASSRTYWARFESVFGERFQTRNPIDPRESATFMRVTELDP